jgi:hypothetical protein
MRFLPHILFILLLVSFLTLLSTAVVSPSAKIDGLLKQANKMSE